MATGDSRAHLTRSALIYVSAMVLAGSITLVATLAQWQSDKVLQFAFYLVFATLSSHLKVNLPGINSTMSVNYVFILISVTSLTLPETVLIGCISTLAQCLLYAKVRPKPVQLAFNLAGAVVSTACCYAVFNLPPLRSLNDSVPLRLFWASGTYFLVNTVSISGIIALTEGKRIWQVWYGSFFWTAPQYLVGATLAWIAHLVNQHIGWETSVLVLPAIFLIERSYRLYLGRLDQEKKHVEKVSDLHLRTIRALALAIDAKDQNTHDHLHRVQVYATEVARELGAGEETIQALQAAALLHDIGKLAVPEYIVSKPGRLTPEEFEKMKVHPVIGAEILGTINFPYPVVPIVRHHHEKWNGTGYPDGLHGEEIPLGARILAAVDCLDALASDRPYRRALLLREAVAAVALEAGTSFDPQVVQVLKRRYVELEELAKQGLSQAQKLASTPQIHRGHAPAAGFETMADRSDEDASKFISSIAAARHEFQMLHEVTRDLGNSLSVDQTLSLLATRLKSMVPYDAIAIYVLQDGSLYPQFAEGRDASLLSALRIPSGQGLSGWVAENKTPIVNGNPGVEPGYLSNPACFTTLRSALAVPLEGVRGTIGVLTLYRTDKDAFNKDHLRILLTIASKAGLTIENALEFREAQHSAVTDGLTGLPNARSLFLHLESELARCRRTKDTLTALVLDLDGFKKVNDSFGHLEGNRVLKLVAQGLKDACREYDYVARMGGDEFVVVLPGADVTLLDRRIREFCGVVEFAGACVTRESILSLSVGAASFPDDGCAVEELMAKADQRMYEMKQSHHRHAPPPVVADMMALEAAMV